MDYAREFILYNGGTFLGSNPGEVDFFFVRFFFLLTKMLFELCYELIFVV